MLIKECLSHILDMQDLVKIGFSTQKIDKLSDEECLELANYFHDNGIKFQCEHFAKLTNDDIGDLIEKYGADKMGKVDLYDGKTGEKFESKVLVGYQLIMKLCHLVSKKIHARSIGPYSLVNQQPLGGKARFGGQRCGEMEVWALEAHGAAFNCNELLTTKSDDQKRRTKAFSHLTKVHRYSLIITGTPTNKMVGESFRLLMYELRAAGFDLFLVDEMGEKIERWS
jgi:DNA-directed RNA polymerase subunit beta